jgi:hypothetical protein
MEFYNRFWPHPELINATICNLTISIKSCNPIMGSVLPEKAIPSWTEGPGKPSWNYLEN